MYPYQLTHLQLRFPLHTLYIVQCPHVQAGEGSVELFKDKDEDVGSYSSSTVSVRIGKFDDGQIVIGDEMWEVEPYEVSNDSEDIYLITKDKDSPAPPPVNPKVPSMFHEILIHAYFYCTVPTYSIHIIVCVCVYVCVCVCVRDGQLTGFVDIFFVNNRYHPIFTTNNNCER